MTFFKKKRNLRDSSIDKQHYALPLATQQVEAISANVWVLLPLCPHFTYHLSTHTPSCLGKPTACNPALCVPKI
jgi:hypothetical protein